MGYHISSDAGLSALPGYATAKTIQRRIAKDDSNGERTPLFGERDAADVASKWHNGRAQICLQFSKIQNTQK